MENTYREAPKWPKVVGGISIGWSVLGLGCMGCGLGALVFFKDMMPQEMRDMPSMQFTTAQAIQASLGVLMGLLLIAAGVLTCMRQRAGRTLHLVYGFLSLPMFFYTIIVQIGVNERMREWIEQNPGSPAAQGGPGGQAIGELIGYVVAAVFGLVYPVFLLIWFGAIKHEKDAMRGSEE